MFIYYTSENEGREISVMLNPVCHMTYYPDIPFGARQLYAIFNYCALVLRDREAAAICVRALSQFAKEWREAISRIRPEDRIR